MFNLTNLQALLLIIGLVNASYVPLTLDYSPHVVGHTVHSIPTAVSHQSQTIVHNSRPVLRPIVHHEPIINSHVLPVSSYAYEPFVYSRLGYDRYPHWSPTYQNAYTAWRK